MPVHVQSLPGPDNLRVLSQRQNAGGDWLGRRRRRHRLRGDANPVAWGDAGNQFEDDLHRALRQPDESCRHGVERGASYIYWIRTRNSHGVGSLREVHAQAGRPIEASELAPSNLTAKLVDDGISLEWDAPVEDAESVTGYKIARGPVFVFGEFDDEGALRWLADTGNANTAFVDGLISGRATATHTWSWHFGTPKEARAPTRRSWRFRGCGDSAVYDPLHRTGTRGRRRLNAGRDGGDGCSHRGRVLDR